MKVNQKNLQASIIAALVSCEAVLTCLVSRGSPGQSASAHDGHINTLNLIRDILAVAGQNDERNER